MQDANISIITSMSQILQMQRMKKIVAYLHDVVEDTSMTIEDLAAEGFSKTIIQAIDANTKKNESYAMSLS